MWIGYFKGQPTEQIIYYRAGRRAKAGAGLAFFYWKPHTQIVAVPQSRSSAGAALSGMTRDHQTVAIQGEFTYRIANPETAAAMLDFSIDPVRRIYLSDDPKRLPHQIGTLIQAEAGGEIRKHSLEEMLQDPSAIAAATLERIRAAQHLEPVGVDLLSLLFISIKASAEAMKALEAVSLERLRREADDAARQRQAAALDHWRHVQERELEFEIYLERRRQEATHR